MLNVESFTQSEKNKITLVFSEYFSVVYKWPWQRIKSIPFGEIPVKRENGGKYSTRSENLFKMTEFSLQLD